MSISTALAPNWRRKTFSSPKALSFHIQLSKSSLTSAKCSPGWIEEDDEGPWHATATSAAPSATPSVAAENNCLACMVVAYLETDAYGEERTVVEAQLLAVEVLMQGDVDYE